MDLKRQQLLKDFIRYCKKELNIQSLPHIKLVSDPAFVMDNRSFGGYYSEQMLIKLFYPNRNLADLCRSLAHELTHHRQKELNMLEPDSGETGTEIENEANAMAGIIMREYGALNPGVYDLERSLQPLQEAKIKPENETFSAYNGRYLFNVDKVYSLIDAKKIPYDIKKYSVIALKQFSHPEFSAADPEKVGKLKKALNYDKPLGILVKMTDPTTNKPEWILIDGNHRVRAAAENDTAGLLYEIDLFKVDPKILKTFLKINKAIPHQLFPDDDEE